MNTHSLYSVKCDDCGVELGRTDSVRESAAGGRCDECFEAMLSTLERAGVQAERVVAMRATRKAAA